MSRCFPYPPPGYSRNGATYESLIESIKLQKETDKAKAERKKLKRAKKDKKEKEKEKRKDEEKGKLQKNPNEIKQDSSKVLQGSVGSKEAHKKGTDPTVELLEKSDLTEEHGQPISSHKPSYSSDSTQNSNKRKRDDAIVPDGSGSHGKPIKIRLLKKHKGPDSSKETLCSNSGRTDPQSLCGAAAKLNTWKISTSNRPVPSMSNPVNGLHSEDRKPLVSGNRNPGVPATSGRENIAVQRNLNPNPNPTQPKSTSSSAVQRNLNPTQQKSTPSSAVHRNQNLAQQAKSTSSSENPKTKTNDLQGLRFSTKQSPQLPNSGRPNLPSSQLRPEIPSSISNKSDVGVLHPIRQQPTPSHGRPVLPENQSKNKLPPNPTSNVPPPFVSRKDIVQGFHSGKEQSSAPISGMPVRPTLKRSINEISAPANSSKEQKVEPTRKGQKVEPTRKEQKVELTRSEKKLQKKQLKYEKLIGSWVPPVLEVVPPVDDDQDWLLKSTKKDSISSGRGDIETCHESAASLWRPCARYLAEVDLHALPYTVPF